MPHQPNKSGNFEPIHDAHAIEQVVLVLQTVNPLDDVALQEVREAADEFKGDMPGRAEIQRLVVPFGGPVAVGPIPPSSTAGDSLRLQRVKADGAVESELLVGRTFVTFRTSLYTRWSAVWARASRYLSAIAPIYIARSPIAQVGLTFVDKFSWSGPPNECKSNLLLRPDSQYVCPHVYDAEDLWHSHMGMFLRVDDVTKRLINVNVDCVDENSPDDPRRVRRVVAITTVLTDLMNQPGYRSLVLSQPRDAIEFVQTRIEQLHMMDKKIVNNVIKDEMSKRIALLD